MYSIKVIDNIDAAHRLVSYKGKCENLHGHTFKIVVEVESSKLNAENMVADFASIKGVIRRLDHKYINDELKEDNPTSEFIGNYLMEEISKILKKENTSARIKYLEVWESENNMARIEP